MLPMEGRIEERTVGTFEFLHARLSITPDPNYECPVLANCSEATDVIQNTVNPPNTVDDTTHCRTVYTDAETEEERFTGSRVSNACICPIFRNYECVWCIDSLRGSALIINLKVFDRATLRDIVEDLRERGAKVVLESIYLANEENSGGDHRVFDVGGITEKQSEAMQLAISAGYYDDPRSTDLDGLAKHLGISRSAVSQRLTSAESKLVKEFVHGGATDEVDFLPTRQGSPSSAD